MYSIVFLAFGGDDDQILSKLWKVLGISGNLATSYLFITV